MRSEVLAARAAFLQASVAIAQVHATLATVRAKA
jgi:hypothetical protein